MSRRDGADRLGVRWGLARDVLLSGRTAEDRVNAGPRRTWSDSVKGTVHSLNDNVANLQHNKGGSGDI